MAEQKPTTLNDIINYQPEQYITDDEISLIRSTFKDNDKLIKVLRKVLLPTAFDPELPIEQMKDDAWMAGVDFAQMPVEQVKSLVTARQDVIKFILGGLIKIKLMANDQPKTEQQLAGIRAKNSMK